jgi:hypothetical protein
VLGEKIAEYRGKIMTKSVIEVEGPKIEASVLAKGNCKDVDVNVVITYWTVPTSGQKLYGEGRSVTTSADGEIVTATAQGIGVISPEGAVKFRGSIFYRTNSTRKLSFMDNLMGLFDADVDQAGNTIEKVWEWE